MILSVVLAVRDYEEASGGDGLDGLDGAFLVTLPALSLNLLDVVILHPSHTNLSQSRCCTQYGKATIVSKLQA